MIRTYLTRFWQEEEAVTIVEMVVIIAVILILIIPTLASLGEAENEKLSELRDTLSK